jgi:NTP pyrophosphatase (non-canonical NTP hydrolase)
VTLKELQESVDAYIQQFAEGYFAPLANLARLTEEQGELAREILHAYGPKRKKPSEPPGSIAEELGDIVFVVACLANSLDVDLETAFTSVMEKYRVRDRDRWTRRPPVGGT